MFHMEDIGRTISGLRKSRNMTQMELADKMEVSFQAVSNWERGNSMPDISKLPELSRLFGVSIDELLGEKSELLENITKNKTKEYLSKNIVSADEFENIAPLLKPEQADEIVENARPPFDLSEVSGILPFIGQDLVNELILKAEETGNYKALGEAAPHAGKSTINEIARRLIAKGKSIGPIAPFVSREIIAELAVSCYEKDGMSALDDFAPFIPRDIMSDIAGKEYANRGLRNMDVIAPFLDREYLNGIAKEAIQKDGIKAISSIAPFLDKAMLSEYVREKYL